MTTECPFYVKDSYSLNRPIQTVWFDREIDLPHLGKKTMPFQVMEPYREPLLAFVAAYREMQEQVKRLEAAVADQDRMVTAATGLQSENSHLLAELERLRHENERLTGEVAHIKRLVTENERLSKEVETARRRR